MRRYVRRSAALGAFMGACLLGIGALIAGGYFYVAPGLPQAEELRDIRVQIPLSIYSRDGRLISQFGERRTPVPLEDIPPVVVQAVLAAEDDRFFEHPGIDYQGTLRAILSFILSAGEPGQGGSTITQQIARQYFLTRDRTLVRKFKEWILAIRIEREFTKQEILDIFLNTTFFGQHAHGVAAAAQTFFGKPLGEISLSDAAIIAGIPRGPSIFNPITSPEAAKQRRAYVLRRMRELGFISADERRQALTVPVDGRRHGPEQQLDAPYVAEMVRAEMIRRFGLAAYTAGLKVTTTIDSRLQRAADDALRGALIDYDERHGYRGPLARTSTEAWAPAIWLPTASDDAGGEDTGGIDPADGGDLGSVVGDSGPAAGSEPEAEAAWSALLADYEPVAGYLTGLVVGLEPIPRVDKPRTTAPEAGIDNPDADDGDPSADGGSDQGTDDGHSPQALRALVHFSDLGLVPVELDSVGWAAPYIDENRTGNRPGSVADVLAPGDIVRFRETEAGEFRLGQVPEAQGALVSLDPMDGAVTALSGGFDFFLSNFNRATQSRRQPGSSFKPFVYSAALDRGFTAASIFNDAPIVERSADLEGYWRPTNYSEGFNGPTRLREALIKSLNLVSVRVMQQTGLSRTVDYVRRFGFDELAAPMNPSMSLGAGGVAPLDLAGGYAALANGGSYVEPYIIDRVEDAEGETVFTAAPALACGNCEEPEQRDAGLLHSITEIYGARAPAKRIADVQNIYLMNDMLSDVVRRGTGERAYRELGRSDLRGKTGTTNDRRDAWFAGFNGDIVAAAWVGFDQERSLGNGEQGARTALPMWIEFMRVALDGRPLNSMERPPGIIDVRIDPATGLAASNSEVFEKFRMEHAPQAPAPRIHTLQTPADTLTGSPLPGTAEILDTVEIVEAERIF